jgi:DNA-binding PadR family transcriptional regulator
MTAAVLDVLSLLAAATPEEPEWGLSICRKTGYGTGTVYPALERLLQAGLVASSWEDPQPADRPRRRYFELTTGGRAALQRELGERRRRHLAWATPAPAIAPTAASGPVSGGP